MNPSDNQQIQHEEGRIVPIPGLDPGSSESWDYQYHLKDHLGNVRVTYSTTPEHYEMDATMEDANEQTMFSNYAATSDGAIANSGTHVFRNSNMVNGGLGMNTFLGVNKGDTIKASAYAHYNDAGGSYNLAVGLIEGALFGSFGVNYGVEGTTVTQTNFDNAFASGTALGDRSSSSTEPQAYINYLVFDKEMNFVTASFTQITSASNGTMVEVMATDYIADQEGYVMVYLSNETQGSELVVSWDDLNVYHGKTNVVSTQDYYPFGLTFNEYQRTASSPQRFKYNGKEKDENTGWLDYGLRQYDPELGVWHAIDPSADSYHSWSPYSYVFNNPTRLIDPDGADPIDPRTGREYNSISLWKSGVYTYDRTRSNPDTRLLSRIRRGGLLKNTPRKVDGAGGSWADGASTVPKRDRSFKLTTQQSLNFINQVSNPTPSMTTGSPDAPNDGLWRSAAQSGTYTFVDNVQAEGRFYSDHDQFNVVSVEDNYVTQTVNLQRNDDDKFEVASITNFETEKGEVQTETKKTWWGGTKTVKYRNLSVTETTTNFESGRAVSTSERTYTRREDIND